MSSSDDKKLANRRNPKPTAPADANTDAPGTDGSREGISEGGAIAIRGFLIQGLGGSRHLYCRKRILGVGPLTFELRLVDSDKVDILWVYDDRSRMAEQVKSTIRQFRTNEVREWANELKAWKHSEGATHYQLTLAGPRRIAMLQDKIPDVTLYSLTNTPSN